MRKILQRNEKVELNSFIDEFVKARQKILYTRSGMAGSRAGGGKD